jgi:sarcosine oxidase gamma subunit
VADLRARSVAVLLCSADVEALDALVQPGHGSRTLRTAPDEALFVASPGNAETVVREIQDRIAALDEDALVLDVSDAWSAWTIAGQDAARAFSYLSALDVPSAGDFVQGDVARVAAKVLGEEDGLTILVPAYWHDHLRECALRDARITEAAP